jgi:hypothetical protein
MTIIEEKSHKNHPINKAISLINQFTEVMFSHLNDKEFEKNKYE